MVSLRFIDSLVHAKVNLLAYPKCGQFMFGLVEKHRIAYLCRYLCLVEGETPVIFRYLGHNTVELLKGGEIAEKELPKPSPVHLIPQ